MDGWTIGLIAIVVLGVAAIVTGALVDRRRNRRARTETLAPPARTIPRFSPDEPAPTYLSELQARRPPPGRVEPGRTDAERRRLDDRLRSVVAVRVEAPLVSAVFVTDEPAQRAVLEDPLIVLCEDGVGSIRELLPAMERAALSSRPLVVAAPTLSAEVLATLEVNVIQGKLRLAAVEADASARARIGELTAAANTSVADRQGGYFPADSFGRAPLWVATSKDSVVVTSSDAELIG